MAGFRLRHGEVGDRDSRVSEWAHASRAVGSEEDGIAHASDDERSIAADSWSVKSEYGSTLDGEDTRHVEVDVLETVNANSDEENVDEDEEEGSVLGLRSHWETTYASELNSFQQHGQPGEIWFGESVMETAAEWVARIAATVNAESSTSAVSNGLHVDSQSSMDLCSPSSLDSVSLTSLPSFPSASVSSVNNAFDWKVLDIGTGNGLFLHALAKRGFHDLWGSDYCETAIELAKALAEKSNFNHIKFIVDDLLDTKINLKFHLVTDKGTYDAVCLHPEGRLYKKLYKLALEKLVASGGILVITSCNKTKDELITEMTSSDENSSVNGTVSASVSDSAQATSASFSEPVFSVVDYVRTYPTFRFGGVEGARVCTVAFKRKI